MSVTDSVFSSAAWGPLAFLPVTLSLCVLICHLYIPLGKLSVQIFSLFKTGWLFSYCSVLRVF